MFGCGSHCSKELRGVVLYEGVGCCYFCVDFGIGAVEVPDRFEQFGLCAELLLVVTYYHAALCAFGDAYFDSVYLYGTAEPVVFGKGCCVVDGEHEVRL